MTRINIPLLFLIYTHIQASIGIEPYNVTIPTNDSIPAILLHTDPIPIKSDMQGIVAQHSKKGI